MSFLGSNEEILNTKEQCFICKNHTRFHVNLLKGKSRYSNRNLIDLMDLITNVRITSHSVICQICFIKLQNFDEFTTKALKVQSDLKSMLEVQNAVAPYLTKTKMDENSPQLTEGEPECNEDDSDYEYDATGSNDTNSESEDIYPCDYPSCEKIFKTKSKLIFHQTFHTTERKFQCVQCHKFYKTRVCLRSHMRIHNNANKRVICDMCGDSFTTKQSVLRHFMTAHLKLRPYICQVCGADFGTLVILRLHLMTHGDGSNKNFTCEICSSRFYSRSKLNRHMRGHGEKQFECTICHRKYTQRYNLNAHIRTVHGDVNVQQIEHPKRFVCQLCGNCFDKNKELETHLKDFHKTLLKN